jgi:hypothetical protein
VGRFSVVFTVGAGIGNMTAILLEATLVVSQQPETWQGTADTDSLYVLIASLFLAIAAFIILMRVRW